MSPHSLVPNAEFGVSSWFSMAVNRNLFAVFFFFLLNTGGFSLWGQRVGVEISSPETSPTSQNPIPVNIDFENAVLELLAIDFEVTNGGIGNFQRGIPDYENFDNSSINGFPVIVNYRDYTLSGFPPLEEYIGNKIGRSIISIDIDSNGNIFYLTYGEGVFRYIEDEDDENIIDGDEFDVPLDLVIDNNDRIIVADPENLRVRIYNSNGTHHYDIGGNFGNGNGDFYGPTGLAVNDANILYVADQYSGEYEGENVDLVKLYNLNSPSEDFIRQFGFDILDDPYRIAVDGFNNVYVSDSGDSGRVLVFNDQDEVVDTLLSSAGDSPGSIITDEFGYVYIINYNGDLSFSDIYVKPLILINNYEKIQNGNYQVDVYSPFPNLDFVTTFSENLNLPIDLALDRCNNIFVNDLELGGQAESILNIQANFDFYIEKFQRQDNFSAEVVPNTPGLVEVFLEGTNLFKCDPQPEGEFSIVYQPKEENTPPVANDDDFYETNQDEDLIISAPGVLANDTDEDDVSLTAEIRDLPSNGTLTFNPDGSLKYEPDEGFWGTDTFTYVASDGEEFSNEATVTITVHQVIPPNTPPVANDDDFYETNQDEDLTISAPGVLANDTDADDEPLTAEIRDLPSKGIVTLNLDGSFKYEPDEGFWGIDTFTYVASDGEDFSNEATVTITVYQVIPPNTSPVANDDEYFTPENTTLNISSPGILENDSDPDGDDLTARLVTNVSVGDLTLNGDGSFTYVPPADYAGSVTFTYVAKDGELISEEATVTITIHEVTPENTAPEAQNNSYSVDQDGILQEDAPGVLKNDTDADKDELTAELINDVSNGTLIFNPDGSFTYEPDPGYFGLDTFTYVATDGDLYSEEATVTIMINEVTPKNTVPSAQPDSYTTKENTNLKIQEQEGILTNDTDADGDALTAELKVNVLHGNLTLNSDGSFEYIPATNFTGEDSFTYVAFDGEDYSEEVMVTIEVISIQSTNNPPVARDDNYTINQDESLSVLASGVLENDTDADGDALTAELKENVLHGNLTLNSDGSFEYVPATDFTGEDSFTYVAFDGEDYSEEVMVTIAILPKDSFYFTCVNSYTVFLDSNGEAGLDINALYETNAENSTVSVDRIHFDCSDVGEEISVHLDYEYNGVQDSCYIPIMVKDTLAPTIFTQNITVPLEASGTVSISAGDVDDGSFDNCRITSLNLNISEFDCDDLGENVVLLTIEDAAGNTSSAEAIVTITDPDNVCPNGPEPPGSPETESFLIIYPNPGEGMVKIATSEDIVLTKARVFDMRGRFLLAKEFESVSNGNYAIDLRQFQSGVYTLQLFSEEEIFVRRAIIRIN